MSGCEDMTELGFNAETVWLSLLITLLALLTAVNAYNCLSVRCRLHGTLPPPDDRLPITAEPARGSTNTESTANPSYTGRQSPPKLTELEGDVIELDDLVTDVPESSMPSPSPSEYQAGASRPRTRSNSLGLRTRPDSTPLQSSRERSISRATSRESLQPQTSVTSFFGPERRRRRRPNDTESRGSEVYRLEPYDPYYRRRAASVPTIRTGFQDG